MSRPSCRTKFDQRNAKLQAKLEQAKKRVEQIRNESAAKIEALKKRAETARADRNAALTARIEEDSSESAAVRREADVSVGW